jgi:prepilin-type N-terminal cleavage/methylation domain-containing protein
LNKHGYTLIELSLVIFLLGLMLFLAVPKVRDGLINDALSASVRRTIGVVRALRADSVREQVDYVLQLDFKNNAFWTYSLDMTPEKQQERKEAAYHFPAGVKIADIDQPGLGKKTDGEATVKFYKQGYIQPTVIHLAREDRFATIVLAPFLSTIKIYEKYVEITPEGGEQY